MILNLKTTLMGATALGMMLLSASTSLAQVTIFDLQTTGATGTLYLTNANNEVEEPNTPAGKDIEYPYYWDPGQNLWVVIAAEQLSASYTYAYEEANFTVLGKNFTDSDFGTFSFGQLSWTTSLVTGVGIETLGVSQFTLTLDLSEFAPLTSPRNINNEFAWNYAASVSGLSGTGLTFLNGQLAGMDFVADVSITPQLLGNPLLAFGSSYDGSVVFSGAGFAFDVDVIQDNTSFLGALTDTHLVFDTAGTVLGVVPEPGTATLLAFAAAAYCYGRTRRRKRATGE